MLFLNSLFSLWSGRERKPLAIFLIGIHTEGEGGPSVFLSWIILSAGWKFHSVCRAWKSRDLDSLQDRVVLQPKFLHLQSQSVSVWGWNCIHRCLDGGVNLLKSFTEEVGEQLCFSEQARCGWILIRGSALSLRWRNSSEEAGNSYPLFGYKQEKNLRMC